MHQLATSRQGREYILSEERSFNPCHLTLPNITLSRLTSFVHPTLIIRSCRRISRAARSYYRTSDTRIIIRVNQQARFISLPQFPVGVRSTMMSVSVCLSVCLHAYLTNHTPAIFTKFSTHVACDRVTRPSSGGIVMRCLLPVYG